MKITIQDNTMIYSCDYSVNDKMDGGFLTEYYPSCKEAVDDALELLSCLYGREEVGNYLLTDIPAKDYATKEE